MKLAKLGPIRNPQDALESQELEDGLQSCLTEEGVQDR